MTNGTKFSDQGNERLLRNYFKSLINSFFKILPLRESGESSVTEYMRSLQIELLGLAELSQDVGCDSSYLSVLSILQYLISAPNCPIREVKREVFKAISLCNKLENKYTRGAMGG